MVAIRLREVLGQWMVDDGRHPRTGIWHLWHLWPSCRARLPSFQSVASSSYESYMWSYVFYHQFDHHHQVHQVFFPHLVEMPDVHPKFPWDFHEISMRFFGSKRGERAQSVRLWGHHDSSSCMWSQRPGWIRWGSDPGTTWSPFGVVNMALPGGSNDIFCEHL